jgi:hypothetical protein
VVALVFGLFLALGPVWGLLYTLWSVLIAVAESERSITLHEVKQFTLSLRPTLVGAAVAPIGIALCAWCVMQLAELRKRAYDMEHTES